jgi:tape measure domain-containing protein
MALGTGGSLGTLTLYIKADTTNVDAAINSVEQKIKKYGSQFSGVTKALTLTPTVDDSALTNLNKHLDLKQQHFGQVNSFFKSKPLSPGVDLSQLNSLETKLKNIQRLSKEVLDDQSVSDAGTGTQQQGRGGVSVQPTIRVNPRLASVTNRIGGSDARVAAGGLKGTVPVGKVIDAAKIIITSASISIGATKNAEGTKNRTRTSTSLPASAPGLNPKVDETVADSLALKLAEIERRIDRINSKTISIKEERGSENNQKSGGINPIAGAVAAIAFQGLAKGISASIATQVQSVGDGLLKSFAESETFKNLTKTLNIPPEVAQSFGREAGKEFKKGQQTGILGFLSKTVGNIFSGITQGIGYRISSGMIQGLERSFGVKLKDVVSDAFEAAFNQTKDILGDAAKNLFNIDFGGEPPTPPTPPGNVIPFRTKAEHEVAKAVNSSANVVKFPTPKPPDSLKMPYPASTAPLVVSQRKEEPDGQPSASGNPFGFVGEFFQNAQKTIQGGLDGLGQGVSDFADYLASLNPFFQELIGNLKILSNIDLIGGDAFFDKESQKMEDRQDAIEQKGKEKNIPVGFREYLARGTKILAQAYFGFYKFVLNLEQVAIKITLLPAVILKSLAQVIPAFRPLADILNSIKDFYVNNLYGGKIEGFTKTPPPNEKTASGKDYSEVLGVSRTTPRKEVIARFKELAAKNHPDRGGSPEQMQEITEAYSIWKQRQERLNLDARSQEQKPTTATPDALKQVMTEGVGQTASLFSIDGIANLFSGIYSGVKTSIDLLLGSISSFFGAITDNIAKLADQFGLIELDKTDDQKIQEVFADLVRQMGAEAGESVSDSQIPQLRFDDDITQAYGSKGLYFPNREQKTLANGKTVTVEQNTLLLRKEAQKMLLAIANGIDPQAISDQYGDAAESLTHEVKHAFQFKFGQADYGTLQATGNFGNVTPLEKTSQYAQMYAEQATLNANTQNTAAKHENPEQYLDFIKNIEADAENFGGKFREVFRPVTQKHQERAQVKANEGSQQLNLVQQIFKPITDLLGKLAAQVQGLAKATLAIAVKSINETKEWFKHLYQDPAFTLQQAAMAPLKIAGDALSSPVRAVEQNIRDSIAKSVAGAKASLEQFDIKVEGEEEFGVAASALYETLSLGVDLLPLDQLVANFGDILEDIKKLQGLKVESDNQFAQFGQIMSQLPAIRQLIATGARNRKDKNIKSAAADIYKNYDPIQGNEFDADKEVQLFAVGGYRQAMGMDQPHAGYGSIELAEQFKIATGNDQSVQVNPHVNAYSDSPNAVNRTVGNVIGTQANEDAVALARRAYAAHRKNPNQRLVLGGHSGGGYNVQDALEILKELGVPASGFGMQTPDFNITRKLGVDDYQSLGLQGDATVNDKLELVKAAGFNAGQDKQFKGTTHSPDEFLGRKDSGEAFLSNVYGEQRNQPAEVKGKIGVYNAPRVIQEFNKTADMARAVMRDNPNSPIKTKEALAQLRIARDKASKAIAKFPEGLKRSIQQTIDQTDYVEAKLEILANAQGRSVLSDLKAKFGSIGETDIDSLRNLEKEVFGKLGIYAESIDVQLNDLISDVGKKLREAKKLARANAAQSTSIAPTAQPIIEQPQQSRAETSFRALVARSAKASNYGLDTTRMPKLVVDNKRLQQAGAKALYSVKDNQIVITSAIEKLLNSSPEELKKFGSKYAEEVKDLIHEIRHAFQFDMGKLSYADLADGATPGAMTPFNQTSSQSQQYGSFAANTDYYKQYAAQMPSGFLDIVKATEADATNFESMWQDIMQGLISDLEQVQGTAQTAIAEPVAYKFNMPGAFGSAASTVAGQAQSLGNSAANKLVEELDKAQKHLNKIVTNPKLQQSFGKLQQDAGNLSTRMGVLIQSIQSGTVDIGELPDEIGRIFGELQEVATAASAVPANLRPQETWRERAGNAARSFRENAFGGAFDPRRTIRPDKEADPAAQAEIMFGRFAQVVSGEESAFSIIQAAIIGDWGDIFFNFYEEVDKALDAAAESVIGFVEKIPGLQPFANFLRGAKQFKAVALGLIGLQLAFKGFEELRQVFDGIEEAFIQAAMGAEKFQRTLTFVLGDSSKATAAIERLQEESNKLGTDAGQSIQGYSQLGAAAKETALEGSGVDQISSAINQASAVYSLNPEEQGRVNTAVSQMISKNTVSAEELRQQLGEVLPGSFNIAARAAGKTTAEFNQMLESGQVLASDFLPKFAQQLSAETSSGLTGALNSSQAATNRLGNAINKFRVSMGKGLLPERNFVLNKMAQGMELVEKHAQTLANIMGMLFFRALFKAGGALVVFSGNLINALTNVSSWLRIFAIWDKFIVVIINALKRLAIQFVVFTLMFDMISMFGKAWNDASGGLNNFVKSSEEGMRKYTEAINEARSANKSFESSLPKDRKDLKGSSLLEDTFVGGLVGKENARGFENLLVDSLNKGMITGAPIKLLTGGKGLKKYAEKRLEDTDLATNEIMSGANQSMSQILTYRGGKKTGATGELRKVQDIDKKLKDVQAERRGLSRRDPGNMEGIKALQKQESDLLKDREKNFKPLGAIQSKLQGEIDGMKEALKKYDELAEVGGVDQETYKTKTDQLKASLAAAEKQQIEFNRSISGAADSFTYLQRSLQDVVDKLAGADTKIKALANSGRRALLQAEASGSITSGQSQFAQGQFERQSIEAQMNERQGAVAEINSILSQLNVDKVLEANGIKNVDDVSAQELNTLADRSKDSPQDAEVFKRLAEVKGIEVEIDDLATQVEEKKLAAVQQIKDANKQIADYFRDISRQSAELALSAKESGAQIALQQQKNKLKSALQGFQDNLFTSFIDSIIEDLDLLNEPILASIERERETTAANNAKQDRDRQTSEIYKSLPLQTEGIKLDFSAIDSAPVKQLEASLAKSAEASKNVTTASKATGDAIADSSQEAKEFGSNVDDVVTGVGSIESATGSVTSALQDNVTAAQDVNSQLQSNKDAIDSNRVSVEDVNAAVLTQTGNIYDATIATEQSTQTTNILQQAWSGVSNWVMTTASQTWDWFKGIASNIPFLTQIGDMIGGWSKNIQDLIGKTWEWIKGLADNIPFLQQIGSTVGGWGNAISGAAQSAGDAIGQQIDRLTNWAGGGGKVTERYRTGTLAAQEYGAARPGRQHAGQDIDVSGNQEAQSFIGGVVTKVVHNRDGAGYGSYVDVYNKALGVVERIAEVLDLNVKVGQEIKAGQAIGRGESHTGVFHYEIRKPDANGQGGYGFEGTQDPIKYYEKLGIAKREGNEIKILKGMNAGQTLNAKDHHLGDGHNHFGEDDLKKANQSLAMNGGTGGKGQMQGLNQAASRGADQFVGAVLSILEAPTRQGRVDVAQVVANRAGNNFGGYGGNIRDQAFASGQFQPFFRETYGIGKGDIKDQSSAVAALKKAGYSTEQAMAALNDFFADISDSAKVADSQSKIAGRAYFKGVSEQRHMRGDDFLRNKNENFFHYEDSDPNRKMIPISSVFGGTKVSGNMLTGASSAPSSPQPMIAPVPFASLAGASYSGTSVNVGQLSAAQAESERIRKQQEDEAIKKEAARVAQARTQGEVQQRQREEKVRQSIREQQASRIQLSRQMRDLGLDTQTQTPDVENKKAVNSINDQFEDMGLANEEEIRKTSTGLDKLKELLAKLTAPGYIAPPGQDVTKDIESAQKAIASSEAYLADLKKVQSEIGATREAKLKFQAEQAGREKKLREQQEKFATEEVSISVLEAEAQRINDLKGRGIRDQGVENLPKLEATIAARKEDLQLKQKITEIDEKIRVNKDNPVMVEELNQQKVGLQDRLTIVKKTIEENRKYAETIAGRENEKRTREQNTELARGEIAVLKQRLEAAQAIAQINPLAPEALGIPEMEKVIALKEAELALSDQIAAIEDKRFSKELTDAAADKRIADLKTENEQLVANVNKRAERAAKEQEFARRRATLENKNQDIEVKGSVTEALSKNIEYGRSKGNAIEMRSTQQQAQQQISFERQMLDLDELENSGKRTKEEIDALRKAYTQLNEISLDNLKAEQQRATEDQTLAIAGRMTSSSNALLEEEAARYDRFGFGKTGDKFREQSAVASQVQAYAEQQVELERFIASQNVSVEKAQQLRSELETLNQVKLDGINESFSPLKDVISGTAGSFKGLFTDLLSGTKSVGESFKSFIDSILSNLANLASEYLTNELFSGLIGGGKKSGGGGGGLLGGLMGIFGGGGAGGGGGLGFLSAVPNLLGFADGGVVGDRAHILAYASGGTVSGCGCRACSYAKGGEVSGQGLQMAIEEGLRKESALTGRKSRLIIASDGEIVIPHKVVNRLTKQEKAILSGQQAPPSAAIPSFASGGMVGANMGNAIASQVTQMGGSTKIEGSTVNVGSEGSMSKEEAARLKQMIDASVIQTISRQTRPRGLLAK